MFLHQEKRATIGQSKNYSNIIAKSHMEHPREDLVIITYMNDKFYKNLNIYVT